jgi:hypothetical protein
VFSRAIVAATGACSTIDRPRINNVVAAVPGRGGPRRGGGRPRLQPGPHGEEGQRELDQLSADDVRGTLPAMRSLSLSHSPQRRPRARRPTPGLFPEPPVLSVLAHCTTLYVIGLWRVQSIALISFFRLQLTQTDYSNRFN